MAIKNKNLFLVLLVFLSVLAFESQAMNSKFKKIILKKSHILFKDCIKLKFYPKNNKIFLRELCIKNNTIPYFEDETTVPKDRFEILQEWAQITHEPLPNKKVYEKRLQLLEENFLLPALEIGAEKHLENVVSDIIMHIGKRKEEGKKASEICQEIRQWSYLLEKAIIECNQTVESNVFDILFRHKEHCTTEDLIKDCKKIIQTIKEGRYNNYIPYIPIKEL